MKLNDFKMHILIIFCLFAKYRLRLVSSSYMRMVVILLLSSSQNTDGHVICRDVFNRVFMMHLSEPFNEELRV